MNMLTKLNDIVLHEHVCQSKAICIMLIETNFSTKCKETKIAFPCDIYIYEGSSKSMETGGTALLWL